MFDYVSIVFIRFFLHPFTQNTRTEYRYLMNDSSNIVISCPAEEKNKSYGIPVKKFSNLFPDKTVKILYPEHTIEGYKIIPNDNNGYPKKIKYNLFHLMQSNNLSQLNNQKFDILIDLDPNINLLNLLLCRQLNPAVRISFDKSESKHFYNIRYTYNSKKSYSENRSGLYRFLKSMINTK